MLSTVTSVITQSSLQVNTRITGVGIMITFIVITLTQPHTHNTLKERPIANMAIFILFSLIVTHS
jgi:hypothetical protein